MSKTRENYENNFVIKALTSFFLELMKKVFKRYCQINFKVSSPQITYQVLNESIKLVECNIEDISVLVE
jgi:hypothetical protein